MLDKLIEKVVTKIPKNRRDKTIKHARSLLNLGYRLYALPLRVGALPLLRMSRMPPVGGTPIPRFYWNDFLTEHRTVFRGHGLEIDTDSTIRRFGGSALAKVDILNVSPGPDVTIVADLCNAHNISSDQFDVFINQFTLHLVADVEKALYHSIRILKPGGHLVVNFPCVSGYHSEGLPYSEPRTYAERWFTPKGVERLLEQFIPPASYIMQVYGNRQTRASYVLGIGSEALPNILLRKYDPHWPLLIGVVITKPERWQPEYVLP